MSEFNGSDYIPARDDARLGTQLSRVKQACSNGMPMTLAAIAKQTGDPEASVSAQLRHLRKKKHGSHTVDKVYIDKGLYTYQLTLNN
jgi:hypothetical protein